MKTIMKSIRVSESQYQVLREIQQHLIDQQTPESAAARVSLGYVGRLAVEHGINVLRSQIVSGARRTSGE